MGDILKSMRARIIEGIDKGKTNKQIAHESGASYFYVVHVRNQIERLRARIAKREGIVGNAEGID